MLWSCCRPAACTRMLGVPFGEPPWTCDARRGRHCSVSRQGAYASTMDVTRSPMRSWRNSRCAADPDDSRSTRMPCRSASNPSVPRCCRVGTCRRRCRSGRAGHRRRRAWIVRWHRGRAGDRERLRAVCHLRHPRSRVTASRCGDAIDRTGVRSDAPLATLSCMAISCAYCGGEHDRPADVRACWTENGEQDVAVDGDVRTACRAVAPSGESPSGHGAPPSGVEPRRAAAVRHRALPRSPIVRARRPGRGRTRSARPSCAHRAGDAGSRSPGATPSGCASGPDTLTTPAEALDACCEPPLRPAPG